MKKRKKKPKPPMKIKGKMRVRLTMWSRSPAPRYKCWSAGAWWPVKSLAAARKLAEGHGYDGIQVEPR